MHRLTAPVLVALGAVVLLAPAETRCFDVYGDVLDLTQRDFRIRNSFMGLFSNTNQTPDPDFPGSLGAELAIRKGVAEWGSRPHGSGLTDPLQDELGSGASNFDAFYVGRALVTGNRDSNIISAIPGGGGAFAFTDLPIGDGWRIRFLDASRDWNDNPLGPTGGSNALDIQGVATHEFGHALGLDHSQVPGATMNMSVIGLAVGLRSIEADDMAGVQFLYGPLSGLKPEVDTYSLPIPGIVRIEGGGFDASGNEVWFTAIDPLVPGGGLPVKVTGVASQSGGTVLDVVIPAEAGPGSIAVKVAGTSSESLSNVFPFDPNREPWTAPESYGTPSTSSSGTPFTLEWLSLPSLTAGTITMEVRGASTSSPYALIVSGTTPGNRNTVFGSLLVGGQLRREAVTPLTFGVGRVDVPIGGPAMIGARRYYQAWAPDGPPGGGILSDAIELEFTE